MDYNDADVTEIIRAYQNVLDVKKIFLDYTSLHRFDKYSERISLIEEDLEKSISDLKSLISIELDDMLSTSLGSLEELCKEERDVIEYENRI